MKKSNYKVCEIFRPKDVCHLGNIENVPAWAHMHHGVPQKENFPDNGCFQMSPDFPKDKKFADVLNNIDGFFVVSKQLMEFLLSEKALKQNEVFKVNILNHKRKQENVQYFIIHQINNPRCADESQCIGIKSKLLPETYVVLSKLVLDETKIDSEVAIFRPAEYTERPFFRRDIADKIETAGFSGIEFFEIEGYSDF